MRPRRSLLPALSLVLASGCDACNPEPPPFGFGFGPPWVADPPGDHVDSESPRTAAVKLATNDLVEHRAGYVEGAENPFTEQIVAPCGPTATGGLIVCAGPVTRNTTSDATGDVEVWLAPEAPYVIVEQRLAGPVPLASTEHSYIYAVVTDATVDPADDWVWRPPYDWDLFQDADRWHELIWDHRASRWRLVVTQVTPAQQPQPYPSMSRAVIEGDLITWIIPVEEWIESTGYRVTAFAHDGNFSPTARGADVSGADPTEPLTPLASETD